MAFPEADGAGGAVPDARDDYEGFLLCQSAASSTLNPCSSNAQRYMQDSAARALVSSKQDDAQDAVGWILYNRYRT